MFFKLTAHQFSFAGLIVAGCWSNSWKGLVFVLHVMQMYCPKPSDLYPYLPRPFMCVMINTQHKTEISPKEVQNRESQWPLQPLQLWVYTSTATHWNMSLTGTFLQRIESLTNALPVLKVNNLRAEPLPWLWPLQMTMKCNETLAKIPWAISKCHFWLESCFSKFQKFKMPSCYK